MAQRQCFSNGLHQLGTLQNMYVFINSECFFFMCCHLFGRCTLDFAMRTSRVCYSLKKPGHFQTSTQI